MRRWWVGCMEATFTETCRIAPGAPGARHWRGRKLLTKHGAPGRHCLGLVGVWLRQCSLGLDEISPLDLDFNWTWTGNLILKLVCFLQLFLFECSFCCPWALLFFRPYCSKNGSKTIENMRFLKICLNPTQNC